MKDRPKPNGSLDGPKGSKAFAKELVNMFPLGINASRFSVVSFAENARRRVGWSYDKSEIDSGIDNMTANGRTSISDGFEEVWHVFDGIDDGDPRESAGKVVLLLSDGEQTIDAAPGKTLLQTAVDAAKLVKGQGATVFAWGFGSANVSTLRKIASDPSKAIFTQNVAELFNYLVELVATVCNASPLVSPPPSPPPPSSPESPEPSPPPPPPPLTPPPVLTLNVTYYDFSVHEDGNKHPDSHPDFERGCQPPSIGEEATFYPCNGQTGLVEATLGADGRRRTWQRA